MSVSIDRILVVGLGSIGKRHIRVLQGLYPDVKIAVLRHSRCDQSETEELGLYKCFTNIGEALAFQPQAAIVANPATKHLEVSMLLAQAGVHLLIEKPISAASDGIQKLIDLCKSKKIVLMTAYNLRFSPSLKVFREYIKQKKIGNIYSIHAEVGQYLPGWRQDLDYRKTVSAQKKLGGGVLLELSHEIDYLIWIFGPVKWIKSHLDKLSNLEIDVEDTVNVIIGFQAILGRPLTATLNMDFIRHDTTRYCVAIGENGSLRWNGITGEVGFFSKNGKDWEVLYTLKSGSDYTYVEEIKHFMSSIESGNPPAITGEIGLEVVDVIESIYQSNESGSVVYL